MTNSKISIITATLNSSSDLSNLIRSLKKQKHTDFSWIVCDGGSTDDTLQILKKSNIENLIIYQRKDFGIYDALNFGISKCKSEYYLTVGSDDELNNDAILNYMNIINNSNYDFIAAKYVIDDKIFSPRKGLGWLYGMTGEASSHSVSLLIRLKLHDAFGYYSSRFPIAADQLFVLSSLKGGATIYRANFIAGSFSRFGTSGTDCFGNICELFRVQLLLGRNIWLQVILLMARIFNVYFRTIIKKSSYDKINLADLSTKFNMLK
jgi:glycosyltransferase involved in cell wall biosynthesis